MAYSSAKVLVAEGPGDVASAACRLVLDAERAAIADHGTFSIALAGGSTPRRLYELLATSETATFARWKVFFGDERWVPANDPDSNWRMAREALLDHVPIPGNQIHPIDTGAGTPSKAAMLYSLVIDRTVAHAAGEYPRFDVVLLGLGADGHTASLFPGSSALVAAPNEIAVATWAPSQRTWRVTLTAGVLSAAHSILFLVSGAEKAEALSRVLDGGAPGPGDAQSHAAPPAALVRPHEDGSLAFVVDRAAAAQLKNL